MVDVRYDTAFSLYPYKRVEDQLKTSPTRHPAVVVGGGPIGMAMALDLGRKGTAVLLLDDHEGVGVGSRAICFSRRTLEIADRLGCGQHMVDKGVVWNVGRVFHQSQEVFSFNLSPDSGLKRPAFINLQQPYFEKFLVEQIRHEQSLGTPIEIRGCNEVIGVTDHGDYTALTVDTPDGEYEIETDWLIACDGARSPVRNMMGLGFDGRVFEDNFLIADVKMKATFPTERWFWFEPAFKHSGQSALLHKQPDDIWRIDFQLGWDIDREAELKPEKIRERVDGMLGDDVDYELEWTSIYTFQCRRMQKFRHGSVIFAGDCAHQVSPFGARGANSGIQDIDNLAWKLDLVIKGQAPSSLLDSYAEERETAADENILHSTRATDFLTPKSEISNVFRNAILELARKNEFARPLINSGRLSVPCTYDEHGLNGHDGLETPLATRVGAPCVDAPLGKDFLLDRLGNRFTLLAINTDIPATLTLDTISLECLTLNSNEDPSGSFAQRYLGEHESAVYLIRPDQHICARWLSYQERLVSKALRTVTGNELQEV